MSNIDSTYINALADTDPELEIRVGMLIGDVEVDSSNDWKTASANDGDAQAGPSSPWIRQLLRKYLWPPPSGPRTAYCRNYASDSSENTRALGIMSGTVTGSGDSYAEKCRKILIQAL